ncbi:MAG: protoporphyrinogen oxidase HemJ [Hyphomicrobiaceae bacterium]
MELWLKAFHIMSVIAWMAGLFYLPRLYVYHAAAPVGSALCETFKIMERKLLRVIMNPAMIAAWIFGIWAAIVGNFFVDGWLHAKLIFVVALTAFHGFLAKIRKDFEADANRYSERFYRRINEVPTVLMIAIVGLAVLKPF